MGRRRWSLAGQLLVLQLVIVSLVLAAVTAISLAQSRRQFEEAAERRARQTAEALASSQALRGALEQDPQPASRSDEADGGSGAAVVVRSLAEAARSVGAFTSVLVADRDGTVLATALPAQLGQPVELPGAVLRTGRSWAGPVPTPAGDVVVAQVPVLSDDRDEIGEVVGLVAVSQELPTLLESLGDVVPGLLVYLGVASAVGVAGSLLLARRVKRQTLGLEPRQIAGLVEHREAMLYGIKEGVVALDTAGRVTLANAAAVELLGLPRRPEGVSVHALGLEPAVKAALLGQATGTDLPVGARGRVLVLNRMPIVARGRQVGSVTTLRDRTELLHLQGELAAVHDLTQTLRAQAHEFSNRLHTISGLIELGEYDEVVGYVARIGRSDTTLTDLVTSRIDCSAVAALLVAKASLATEQGVDLRVAPSSRMSTADDDLAADVTTVVGNLVDNALDAVGTGARDGQGWVEVEVTQDDEAVTVVVRDSGPGVDPGLAEQIFERGVSSKPAVAGGRGIGLSLVRLVCSRRGGSVDVTSDGGAVFRARLPLRVPEVAR